MPKLGVCAFALVIISALTGIVVVASGLRSGVVTIHMALAFLQLFVLDLPVLGGRATRKYDGLRLLALVARKS